MSSPRVLSVLFVLLVLSACGKPETEPQSETATYGSFELVADEVLKPVIDSLVQGYTTENPTAKVTVKYVSAGEAVRELMNKQARAIIIDRGLTPQEREVMAKDSVSLPAFRMAEDGIGVVANRLFREDVISMTDLRRNMTDGIREPSKDYDVRGWLRVLFPAYPSSIEAVVDSTVLGTTMTPKTADVVRFGTSDSIFWFVKRPSGGGLGFVSSAWKHWLESRNDTSVKFLPIIPHDLSSQGISEPVMLHIAYIAEGAYPLTTIVNGYTTEAANTVPRGFFVYCMTAHGQTVFKNFGLLPKTQPIKLVPAK